MTKIRMNTELRNKLFNKIKNVFENEDTQEREAFLQAREDVDRQYEQAHRLAVDVVERSYPPEDVAVPTEVKSHFDFGLFGNLNGSEYSDEDGKKFAVAYFREELKAKDCNPDIYAQQNDKQDNPHKTKYVDECMKALGHTNNSNYHNGEGEGMGMTREFNAPYYLDVIGTSYCRSRAIACTKNEYEQFETWRIAKGNLVVNHQKWIDTITKQCDQLKIGIQVDEAELIRTNSTGLTIYNPSNLASMIKGMKNKHQSREAKILARKKYEESIN